LVMLVYLGGYLYVHITQDVPRITAERGAFLSKLLAQSSEIAIVAGDTQSLQVFANAVGNPSEGVTNIKVFDRDGQLLIDVTPEGDKTFLANPASLKTFREPVLLQRSVDTGLIEDKRKANQPPQAIGAVEATLSVDLVLARERQRLFGTLGVVVALGLAASVLAMLIAINISRRLTEVMEAIASIAGGARNVTFRTHAKGEMATLQEHILAMSASIQESENVLEARVQERTRELRRAKDVASVSALERQQLLARMNIVVEDERRQIAGELHDTLGASTVALRLTAERIAQIASQPTEVSNALQELKVKANEIIRIAKAMYIDERALIARLRPEILDTLGLKHALEELVASYASLQRACTFTTEIDVACNRIRPDIAIACYRIAQESMTNVLRHANAKNCRVVAEVSLRTRLTITIEDDGDGIVDTGARTRGLGMVGMRERVEALDGLMTIVTTAGSGTRVRFEIPIGDA
jgi:two-component system, NarL family, sensor histidine kinase UhpB